MPDTTTREDVLLDEVHRLQLHLACEQSLHQETRAKLDAARQTADREWAAQDDKITRLRAERDQLAARRCPLAPVRTAAGRALGAAAITAGTIAALASIGRGMIG